ncbi:MAG: hypothetical protein ACLQGV_09770 [Bryobacteraceae bacterium]
MTAPLQAVWLGAQAVLRARRMLLVFWLCTLAFALAIVLPLGAWMYADLGHSLYAQRMLDNFDLQWLLEALLEAGWRPLFMFPALLAAVTLGYVLLGTFLAGGAIAVFASQDGLYRPGLFYEGCGRNFGRLLRLALTSWLFYALVLGLGAGLKALGKQIWGHGMEERPLVIFGWFRTGLTILLLLLVNMLFDYAKIWLVVEDSRRSRRAAFQAVKLVFRNFGRTSSTYALVAAGAVVLALACHAASLPLPPSQALTMALLLVLQQAFILGRIGVKLWFFAGQLEIYRGIAAAPALAEAPPSDMPAAAPDEC